ncbi:hypothetical protein PJU73_06140 [Neisseria lisongii]|uniref:Mutator family transposase n=2 Tax=Neisseria lisongii TaxID=2912188 RepID=A0ABY7RJI1_9NEIS|nr:hypothetical protein [Neisseria lisongii]WCL70941.1 hypothetical protein PJU73_06140 [Neisseria lisongii]
MNTTYFGRSFGVTVFMNSLDGSIVHISYVRHEILAHYHQGLCSIIDKGIHIQSIIADGFKGITALFPDIPFQLCQFHQQQTIRRYLTSKPKSAASRALKRLSDNIFYTDAVAFKQALEGWDETYRDYLFGELKIKIRCYPGLGIEGKKLFIENFLGISE